MGSGPLESNEVEAATGRRPSPARSASVAVIVRDAGRLPELGPDGLVLGDPSPLRHLSGPQRERRLLGMLELLAMHGDGAAASKALDHYRWQTEMRRGKAPQRIDLQAHASLTVVDTLSAPAGTPIPAPRSTPLHLVDSQGRIG